MSTDLRAEQIEAAVRADPVGVLRKLFDAWRRGADARSVFEHAMLLARSSPARLQCCERDPARCRRWIVAAWMAMRQCIEVRDLTVWPNAGD